MSIETRLVCLPGVDFPDNSIESVLDAIDALPDEEVLYLAKRAELWHALLSEFPEPALGFMLNEHLGETPFGPDLTIIKSKHLHALADALDNLTPDALKTRSKTRWETLVQAFLDEEEAFEEWESILSIVGQCVISYRPLGVLRC